MSHQRTSAAEPGDYLSIESLSKYFGRFQALNDISLAVGKGEFVCFLGPSGCGKTTLLRAIAGLDIQTSGRISQDGQDISSLPPSQRDFGIVFQSYALFPNMSVIDNVGFGLRSLKLSRRQTANRCKELLELVGIFDQARKYPAQLSGGQQQRVALARALAMSPGLLLLDEPLSALDAQVRVRLREELRQLQRRVGVTTIMVTHDQEEALTIADRVLVMNHGRIEQFGSPLQIYRHPATRFVADFVGEMNFLPAVAAGSSSVTMESLTLTCAAGKVHNARKRLVVGIRPEDVVFRGVGRDTPNSLSVRISAVDFVGASFRVQLDSPDLPDKGLRAGVSTNALADLAFEPGTEIRIALPPDRLHVYKTEDE